MPRPTAEPTMMLRVRERTLAKIMDEKARTGVDAIRVVEAMAAHWCSMTPQQRDEAMRTAGRKA